MASELLFATTADAHCVLTIDIFDALAPAGTRVMTFVARTVAGRVLFVICFQVVYCAVRCVA